MRDPFVTISPTPSLFLRDAAVPAVALALLALVLLTQQNQALFLMTIHLAAQFPDALGARWTVLGDALLLLVRVLPWVGRRPDLVWTMWLAALVVTVAVRVLKPCAGEARPPVVLDPAGVHLIGVGRSRMAVGVHWPVDVLAGAAVGWASACGALVLARRWRWGISPRGQRVTALLL